MHVKSQFDYVIQETVHDAPVLDIQFDVHHNRIASVGGGFPQILRLQEDSEQ
jgi:hypothetical protein